jgi:large subunit ribosomal protein L9
VEVILLEKVRKLGLMGDLVNVKSGFARHFLLPKRKALRATKQNIELFKEQKKIFTENNEKLKDEAQILAAKMQVDSNLVLIRHAGKSDHLYGSVTAKDISEVITKSGFTINRSQIIMDKPIKTIGLHDITVTLHPEVETNLVLNIAKSQEEAEKQTNRQE